MSSLVGQPAVGFDLCDADGNAVASMITGDLAFDGFSPASWVTAVSRPSAAVAAAQNGA